jgi:hypothetical protein
MLEWQFPQGNSCQNAPAGREYPAHPDVKNGAPGTAPPF